MPVPWSDRRACGAASAAAVVAVVGVGSVALLCPPPVMAAPGGVYLSEISALPGAHTDVDGDPSDWVEIHNPTDELVPLAGWALTDDPADLSKWLVPDVEVPPGGFLTVFASAKNRRDPGAELHASFRLDGDGEFLALVRPDGSVASGWAPAFPAQEEGVTFGSGVLPGGDPDVVQQGFLESPTPSAPNSPLAYLGTADPVAFSVTRGFFEKPFSVTLASPDPAAQITYTTDGSDPREGGIPYGAGSAIRIERTTVLRATATRPAFRPAPPASQTYLFLDQVTRQPRFPDGFPSRWGSRVSDYEMDPVVVEGYYSPEEVKASLRTYPTVSFAASLHDLFDAREGIYTNSEQRGDRWERAVSVEFFGFPHGEEAQVNAGLKLQGNASRSANRVKHNMRVAFRGRYGATKLRFPLFEDGSGVETFNSIVFRGGNGDSWVNPSVRTRAQYIRDQWHREVQRLMGQPNQPQRYVNLYINGLYWGLYHIFERFDASMLAERNGGAPGDWDALQDTPAFQPIVVDGNDRALRAAHTLSRTASDAASYQELLGYVDVDNQIDYLLLNFYSANQDWDHKNMRYGRRREPAAGDPAAPGAGRGFLFFSWDAERTGLNGLQSQSVTADVTDRYTTLGPTFLNRNMMANSDYQLRFADRVHRHLLGRGELTPDRAAASWNRLAADVYAGLVAEAARWGDLHVSRPERRETNWQRQLDRENSAWFPSRTGILLGQLHRRRFYDTTAPYVEPVPPGGTVAPGSAVVLAVARLAEGDAAPGPVYFTLDGPDPRQPDGTVDPAATAYDAASPPAVAHTVTLRARLLHAGSGAWSPLTETVFTIAEPPAPGDLVVSEISPAPAPPDPGAPGGPSDFEFVELTNTSDHPVDLSGVGLSGGVTATVAPLPHPVVPAGGTALVVADRARFAERYPGVDPGTVVAEFAGGTRLDADGERIALAGRDGLTLGSLQFFRSARWPDPAAVRGYSLEFEGGAADHHDNGGWWRVSPEPGGTPGRPTAGATTFAAWLDGHDLADPNALAPGSGLPALLHYALGLDSTGGHALRFTRGDLPGSPGTLAFTRRRNPDRAALTLERSRDVLRWEPYVPAPETTSATDLGDGTERLVVTLPDDEPGAAPRYWRLRATGTVTER